MLEVKPMKTIVRLEYDDIQPASSYIRRVNDDSAVRLVKEGGWLNSMRQNQFGKKI